jgi:hypothetical protein
LKNQNFPNLLLSPSEKGLCEVPDYFEIHLEVKGVDRMELTPKILEVVALSNLSGIWAGGN